MSDLTIWFDLWTVTFFYTAIISKGVFQYLSFTLFLIFVGIRLVIKYDLTKSKTLSMEELKKEYPEIYYKFYATDEEKKLIESKTFDKKVSKIIKKDWELWLEVNEKRVVGIIKIIVYIVLGLMLYITYKKIGVI